MNAFLSSAYLYAAMAALAGIAALHLWTSRINQFFFFSRTAPRDFARSPEAMTVTRRYIRRVLIGLLISLFTLVALHSALDRSLYVSFMSALCVQVAMGWIAFALAHRAAGIAIEQPAGAAIGHHATESTPGQERTFQEPAVQDRSISVLLAPAANERTLLRIVMPLGAAAALWCSAVLVSGQGWSRFADAAGEQGGAVLLGMATGMLVSGTIFLLLQRYSSRHRTPMARYIGRIMSWLTWFSVALAGGIAAAGLRHVPVTKSAARGVMFFILGLLAVHFFYAWSRMKQFTPPAAEQNGDHFWRWGQFYYNAGDPALFVQSRGGPGYTLNFGNVYAWPISALIVGNFLFLALSRHHG